MVKSWLEVKEVVSAILTPPSVHLHLLEVYISTLIG